MSVFTRASGGETARFVDETAAKRQVMVEFIAAGKPITTTTSALVKAELQVVDAQSDRQSRTRSLAHDDRVSSGLTSGH